VARGVGEGKSQEMPWSAHPSSYDTTQQTIPLFVSLNVLTNTFQVYAAAERKK